jgi:hypothetical protein
MRRIRRKGERKKQKARNKRRETAIRDCFEARRRV